MKHIVLNSGLASPLKGWGALLIGALLLTTPPGLGTEAPAMVARPSTPPPTSQTEATLNPKDLEAWLPEKDLKCIEGLDELIAGDSEFSAPSLVKTSDIFSPHVNALER